MHPIAFRAKRLHHRNLAHGRQLLARYQLTPARFDLVYALYEHRQFAHKRYLGETLRQVDLCKLLGVTSRTVARMVASLIELKFLQRARCHFDRRSKSIAFTAEGLLRVRRAVHAIVHKNPFQRLFHKAFPNALPKGTTDTERYRSPVFFLLDGIQMQLFTLGKFLGDFSSLRFPAHHPDD